MKVFKRKQIVVLSLVLMIVVAGYLQYSYRASSISVSEKDGGKLGEAVYVDSKDMAVEDDEASKDTDKNSKDPASSTKTKDNKAEADASKAASDYFSQAKMDKESTRGKDKDALKELISDKNATKEVKAKAYNQMMKLVENSEKEMKVENLIKEKGFSDAVAFIGDDGSIDIVIKAPNITAAQAAQVSDIVTRQTKVAIDNIHIKNIY